MLNHLLFVLACFGHFSAEAKVANTETADQQAIIRKHLGNVNKVIKCSTYSPEEIKSIGLGADKLDNTEARLSKVEKLFYGDLYHLYHLSQNSESCSTTLVPNDGVGDPPTTTAPTNPYLLYICNGNIFTGSVGLVITLLGCSFLEAPGVCPYTDAGYFDVSWNGDYTAMGCIN